MPRPVPVIDLHTPFGNGPQLTYHSARDEQGRTVTYVDRQALDDPRERAICRALLLHALALLDATEPTRTNGAAP